MAYRRSTPESRKKRFGASRSTPESRARLKANRPPVIKKITATITKPSGAARTQEAAGRAALIAQPTLAKPSVQTGTAVKQLRARDFIKEALIGDPFGRELVKGTVPIGPAAGMKAGAGAIDQAARLKRQGTEIGEFWAKAAKVKDVNAIGKLTAEVGKLSKNTATSAKIWKWVGVAFGVGMGAWMAKEVIEGPGFGAYGKTEVATSLSYTAKNAVAVGDYEMAQEIRDEAERLLEPGNWSTLKGFLNNMPVTGPTIDLVKAARSQLKNLAWQGEIADLKKAQEESGETDAEMWLRIDEERRAREIMWREQDQADWRAEKDYQRMLNIKKRIEERAYWKKVMKAREEERAAEREYWQRMREEWLKSKEENARSRFSWGLL